VRGAPGTTITGVPTVMNSTSVQSAGACVWLPLPAPHRPRRAV